MAKEYDVIDLGYIGSFIDERADNDGYDIKKSISLGIPDNNVWVVNPRTGVLESKISMGDTNDPQFVQFNGTKPTSPSTDLVIKYIGKTIKVTNITNTELCISQSFSGSNFTYTSGQIPPEYKKCEKVVYFTSNNMLQWPTALQTEDMLNDLSKKIPYDIGFSKKNYKIIKLSDKQLMDLEKETKVSYSFLKNLSCLALFDSEYPSDLEYSNIKIGYDWDGFSIDKNDANNLVYSDYYKKTNTENTNYVFLVTDRHIDELTKYFKEQDNTTPTNGQITQKYDPTEYIRQLRSEPQNYGRLHSFIPPGIDFIVGEYNPNSPTLEQVLDVITKKPIYKMDPYTNDVDLAEDTAVTEFFMEIEAQIIIRDIIDNDEGTVDGEDSPASLAAEASNAFDDAINLFDTYTLKSATDNGIVNGKLYELIHKFLMFQSKNNFPLANQFELNVNDFGSLIMDNPFTIRNITAPLPTIGITGDTDASQISPIPIIPSVNMVYKNFDFNSDYSISDQFHVTKPLFLAESDRTNQFYSVTPNLNNSKYFISVHNRPLEDIRSVKIFDIAYAHISGSGSSYKKIESQVEIDHLPAKSMYKKYMAECFGGAEQIKFKNGNGSDYFYALQFDRNGFKDKLNSGNIQITLAPISSSSNQLLNTGSNVQFNVSSSVIFTLIDDSMYTKIYSSSFDTTDECYNLVSGTIQDGPTDYENAEGWGLVFPNKGLILLNGEMLDASCSFNTVTASIDGDNPRKLFLSLSGSCSPNAVRNNHGYWYMRSSELYADENYFCRIDRNEFNYSNNYTYVSGSFWKVYYDKLNNTSKTYITSIGLYNNRHELLAIGKFSRPFLKDSSQEYVINVKLRIT
jgi:hypothetical protein